MRYFNAVLSLAAFGLGVNHSVSGEFGWAMLMFAAATYLAWSAQPGRRKVEEAPDEDVTSTQETFLARGFEPVETPTDYGRSWRDDDWWQNHLRQCPGCREREK